MENKSSGDCWADANTEIPDKTENKTPLLLLIKFIELKFYSTSMKKIRVSTHDHYINNNNKKILILNIIIFSVFILFSEGNNVPAFTSE